MRLRITGHDGRSWEVALPEGETTLGRDPECSLLLDGQGVSRRHARLRRVGDGLTIEDDGSRYGTRVNDETVQLRRLHRGDHVTIGTFRLEVLDGAPRAETLEFARSRPAPAASVQIVDAAASSKAVQTVVPAGTGELVQAVQRVEEQLRAPGTRQMAAVPAPAAHDYAGLLLMYRVSQALAETVGLDSFLDRVADLLLEQTDSDTVVIFLCDADGQPAPRSVRHRGALAPGQVPVSSTLLQRALREQSTVALADAQLAPGASLSHSVQAMGIRSAVATPVRGADRTAGLLYLSRHAGVFDRATLDTLDALATLVASAIDRADLRDRVKRLEERRQALERFHPREVIESMFAGTEHGRTSQALAEFAATALACDLLGYGRVSERLEAVRLGRLLDGLYRELYEVVLRHGGTLVKIADGRALALFGVPQPGPQDAERAVAAALALRDRLATFAEGRPPAEQLKARVALDTGPLVAGTIGPAARLEYVALGEPVANATDLAARGPEHTVLATERVHAQLPASAYRIRTVDRAYGAAELAVYEIVARTGA